MYQYTNRFQNMFNMFSGKYRGMMEPMSRMTMDFQGRYMDSCGRMVDPIYYDYYGRWYDCDRYYGRSMFNRNSWMDNGRNHWYGSWTDNPERHMDMSGYQMDMEGRWMDTQGRHCNPFNQWGYNRQSYYPGYSCGRNMYYPERGMDMSGYQMDMQGRWMDNYGRHVNPSSQSMFGGNMYYPRYSYSGDSYMDNPERYMDMSGYQMDMQGRWMDTQGRHCNPFSSSYGWYNMSYPGNNYHYYGHHPERYMNMYNFPMDNQGQWMDNQGHYDDHY